MTALFIRKEQKMFTILSSSLLMSVVTFIIIILVYLLGKEDVKEKRKTSIAILIGVFFLIMIVNSFVSYEALAKTILKKDLLRRLNLPIRSKEQLRGYRIVGRSFRQNESETLEDSSSSIAYVIDIEDAFEPLIGKKVIFEDLEVPKELFRELKIREYIPPDIDPSAPAAERCKR